MVYLDNAATTDVYPEVADVIYKHLNDTYGNPSSLYGLGLNSKKVLERSRAVLAKALGCDASEVYFTACGTESNNLAILGAARARKQWGNKVIVSGFEHPSVQNVTSSLRNEGFEVIEVLPSADGNLDMDKMLSLVDKQTVLVSCMRVNNETGALTDTALLAGKVKEINRRAAFHCDGVQAFLKHRTLLGQGIDSFSVSAHKIHGPKGIGVLYLRKGFHLDKAQFGGGQERGIRSGTENIPYIAGFAKAVEMAGKWEQKLPYVASLRDRLWEGIKEEKCVVKNSPDNGSPYILNVSLLGFRSETILHFLEEKGVMVSSGSACGHGEKSHTLEAMKLDPDRIDGALRFSFSSETTEEEIDMAILAVKEAVKSMERKS